MGAVNRRDFALVALGAVLWGTGGVAGSALARATGVASLDVATVRLVVGGGLLLLVLAVSGHLHGLRWTAPVVRRVVVTGVLAATYQACYFAAVQATSVGTATVVALGAAPVVAAVVTAVRERRAPVARELVALGLALTGLVLLVAPSASAASTSAASVSALSAASGATGAAGPTAGLVVLAGGVLLALVAAAAFATMTLVHRTPVPGLDALRLTATSFTLGGLLLAALAGVLALAGRAEAPAATLEAITQGGGWWLVVYLGVGPTAVAYSAYFAGLRTVPATSATLLALLEPLTATVTAIVLLDERLTPVGLVGGLLLVTTVVVLRPRR